MDNHNNKSTTTSANAASSEHQQQQQSKSTSSANNNKVAAATTTTTTAANSHSKNHEGTQDLITKTRKLQLEIEEKNEIINILKDELETLREQSDKYQRENLQLVKDAKRVKFLQDENDFLQDKVGSVENLELEIKRLKEKLNELDFFRLRVSELEDDRNRAQDEASQAEKLKHEAESKLGRISDLESEVNKWKSFSHELERARDSIQSKLLESIEQESKLTANNKKVEDEVKRLRDLVKSFEEHRDEEQASTSLKSVGNEVMFAVNQELVSENESLKSELKRKEFNRKELCDELESNRKVISDLRQDLACEKSLAQKLTTQLAQFTKQIKSLDKQYFPMHDNALKTTTTTSTTDSDNKVKDEVKISPIVIKADTGKECDLGVKEKNDTPQALPVAVTPTERKSIVVKTVSNDSVVENNRGPVNKKVLSEQKKKPKHVASELQQEEKSNFVRNALNSRSVNFGHSKSPINYLDHIRASVSATTSTNTVTSYSEQSTQNHLVTLSSNGNKSESPIRSSKARHEENNTANSTGAKEEPNYVLNCMLNHDHTGRCFIDANSVAPAQVQVYGGGQHIAAPMPIVQNHFHTQNGYSQNQTTSNHSNTRLSGVNHLNTSQTSRQLNALIDPVAHEQLYLSMLQQQQGSDCANQRRQQLTEQQIAHLNNLHRQHYYHHLHELYQMHHQHHMHLHHLHQHKCPQQQQQQQPPPQRVYAQPTPTKQAHLPKNVGSQFQAPICEHNEQQTDHSINQKTKQQQQQIYANLDSVTIAHNNLINQANEQLLIGSPKTSTGNNADNKRGQYRKSPQRFGSGQSGNLPQIDELNSFQQQNRPEIVRLTANNHEHRSTSAAKTIGHYPAGRMSSSTPTKVDAVRLQRGVLTQTTASGSPITSSSSPTSSRASSNSSPTSSSSSDSLSASDKLNRSLASRHSTTDLNRRQFTIERESIGQAPMTAKLARVGSCRGFTQHQPSNLLVSNQQQQQQQQIFAMNGLPSPKSMNTSLQLSTASNAGGLNFPGVNDQQFRDPVKTQQPPMKTSKILNISNGQQAASSGVIATAASPSASSINGKQLQNSTHPKKASSSSARYKPLNQLAKNFADIKLNDSLAFSSLRAPKKSSSGTNLFNKSLDSHEILVNTRANARGKSPLGEQQVEQQQRSLSSNGGSRVKNDGNNNNDLSEANPNKNKPPSSSSGNQAVAKSSSVWFEYGCV